MALAGVYGTVRLCEPADVDFDKVANGQSMAVCGMMMLDKTSIKLVAMMMLDLPETRNTARRPLHC